MFFFASTANAVTVRIVEGGTVGLTDAGYFAGIVTLDIDGVQYPAITTDIIIYDDTSAWRWYTDYTTAWEFNIYTYNNILTGANVLYSPEEYSMASWFLLDGMLGYVTSDALWAASYNEMVWNILNRTDIWNYADREYPNTGSGVTLHDVYNTDVANGLDSTYDYSNFMFVIDSGGLTPNVLVFGTPPPAVPIPPAIWLFGSGLIGLVGVARRRKS